LGILPGILKLKKITFRNIFWGDYFKTRKNLKIFIFSWKIVRGGKTPLNLLFFSDKFSNLEKSILGILPGILKLKKITFRSIFWREHFKTRKKIENFHFSLENCKRKNTTKFTIFKGQIFKFGIINFGNFAGILKLKKIIFETFFGGNILKLEKIRKFSFFLGKF
jgi:hypothetical protein